MPDSLDRECLSAWWQSGHPETRVLALSGSRAPLDAGPHSDVDLLAVVDAGEFRRIRERYQGLAVEAMAAPWSWFEHVVTVHARTGNIGTITGMLAQSKILSGDAGRFQTLQALAREYWVRGPAPASPKTLAGLTEHPSTLLGNYLDAHDDAHRLWLGWHLLAALADFTFQARGWWQEKPRRVLAVWAERDPETGRLVRQASAAGFPEEILRRLVKDVLSLP